MLLLAADVAATRAASMACDHVERKSSRLRRVHRRAALASNVAGSVSSVSPSNSRGDFDRNANRETKLAVGAPSVDSDFNKPI